MKITYRFEKSFGPAASFAGVLLFIAGIIATFISFTGLLWVIIGAFVGFTHTCTTVDSQRGQIRFANVFLGIFKVGPWIPVGRDMQIGIRLRHKVYTSYSRSNRALSQRVDERIAYLVDKEGNPVLPLLYLTKTKNADREIERICTELGIPLPGTSKPLPYIYT